MPAGRPTKYRKVYCQRVVELMEEGSSLTAVAAKLGVCRNTLLAWQAEHPEFLSACTRGKALCAAWWEERAKDVAKGNGGPGASTMIQFGLRNMAPDEWKPERIDHTSSDGSMAPPASIHVHVHRRDEEPAEE